MYGLDQDEGDRLYAIFYVMMYAKNLNKFNYILDQMKSVFIERENKDFLNYFLKNWESCKEKWASYARKKIPILGNNTNNRIESSFGKIKRYLNRYLSLYEAVENLLMYQVIKEEKFFKQATPGSNYNDSFHPQLNTLLNVVSLWCFKLVKKEFDFAVKSDKRMVFEQIFDENSDLIKYKVSYLNENGNLNEHDDPVEYVININTSECSCGFSSTFLLPCKHVMAWRYQNHSSSIIPFEHLNERWHKNTFFIKQDLSDAQASEILHEHPTIECTDSNSIELKKRKEKSSTIKPLTVSEKYNEAFDLFKQIASTICEYDMDKFNDAINDFKLVHENLINGGTTKIKFETVTYDDELMNSEINDDTISNDLSDMAPNLSNIDFMNISLNDNLVTEDDSILYHDMNESNDMDFEYVIFQIFQQGA